MGEALGCGGEASDGISPWTVIPEHLSLSTLTDLVTTCSPDS